MESFLQRRYTSRTPIAVREFLAEMMGTFILCIFGIGSVAQLVLSDDGSPHKTFLSVNIGFGFGAAFGVYWSASVSGGHINPAVTLAMVVAGRLPLKKLPLYWAAQTVGAFLASAVAFGVYQDLLDAKDSGRTLATSGIWSPNPTKGVSNASVFGDEFIGTFLLVSTIFALTDSRNLNAPNPRNVPFVIGALVLLIGATFGLNRGYGINPARDLIPRIFTAIAGWKSAPFITNSSFFWIPIIGQLLGGVVGGIVYIITIEIHHPESTQQPLAEDPHGVDEEKF